MTDKELRHLGKGELIEIIYQQKKDEEALRRELQSLKKKLGSRELKQEQVGSIAEAAIAVNGVFEAAQRAADDYLKQIHYNHAGVEEYCEKRVAETEEKCREREEQTELFIQSQWDSFRQRTEEYIRSRSELSGLLGRRTPQA